MPTAPVYHSFESGLKLRFSGTIPGQIGELIIPSRKIPFNNGDSVTMITIREQRYRVMRDADGSTYRIRIR